MEGDLAIKSEDFQCSSDGSAVGPCLAAHLEKQPSDFPIVGLKCITEHHNEGLALTYSCRQCNVEGTMHLAAALAHIRGYKHIHKYLQTFYPEKLSTIGPEISKSEQLQQLIPMALEVMQLEGWSSEEITKTSVAVKKPTCDDHIENKIVRLEGKGLKEHINAWSKSEPLLGVEHIIENRHVGRPSELYYTCDLCSVSSTMISILSHLASGKHRTKYLQTYQPLEEAAIPKELKGSERMARIREIAQEIVKKEGVKNFKVKMLKTEEFKPPVPIARQPDKKVIKRPYADAPEGKFMANKMPRFGMGPPPPHFRRGNFLHRGGPYGMDRGPMFERGPPRAMGPPLPHLVPRDMYSYERRQRYQPPPAGSFYEEEEDYLPPPPPPPQGRLTNDQILDSLVNFKIAGEEEASAARKASNILTQALLQYRLRDIGRPDPRDAQMGFNRVRNYDDGYSQDLPPMRSPGMVPLRMSRPPGPRPGGMPMRPKAAAGTASRMNDYSYAKYDSYM